MRSGDRLELEVEKAVYRGRGLAHSGGRVVFVAGGLPGDRVRAKVGRVRRDWAEAELEALLAPGADRREPPCAYAARCGGCSYQALQYERQLALKREVLVESLLRARVDLGDTEVAVSGSPEHGWRWRARLHVVWDGPRPRLGFHEQRSHALVDVRQCPQLTPGLIDLADELRAGLSADPDGLAAVSEVRLAEGGQHGSRVAALVVQAALDPLVGARLAARLPSASGFGWSDGRSGAPFVPLAGVPYVWTLRPAGVLRSHVLSFFQGNRLLLDRLVEKALRPLSGARRVLDLYAGVGLFSLPLATTADRVRSVEGAPWAAADAAHNLHSYTNVELVEGAVERDLAAWKTGRFDAALIDPPRAGVTPAVVEGLGRAPVERLVYVSCDPTTLARDLVRLGAQGFALRSLELLDLFPDTFHLEAVAALQR